MNLALASIVMARPDGIVRDADMPSVIAADRLCWLLVRCGSGRFSCPAQDLEHLLYCVRMGGDYVRDVSFPSYVIEEAQAFLLEHRAIATHPACKPYQIPDAVMFDERDCGGAFDGSRVTSDADPGL